MTSTTRRLSAALAAGALALVLASCASDASGSADTTPTATETSDQAAGGTQLTGTADLTGSWALVDNDAITLTIAADGSASGSGGCNNIATTFTWDAAGALVVGPAISTRMACADDVMAAEDAFLTALESVNAGAAEGDTLTLFTAEGEELVFTTA